MKSEDKFEKIVSPEVLKFIDDNIHTSIPDLILKGIPFDIDSKLIVNQILGRRKARKKLPSWFKATNIIYPPNLNLEQTSSEITANHKAKIVFGDSLFDLTGGFGVDDVYFSKQINQLYYAEIDKNLSEIAEHNFKIYKIKNIEVLNLDSIKFLRKTNLKFEWIYVDPSRRAKNEKIFMLEDSLPNVLDHMELLEKKSNCLMIKTSPMYDIDVGYTELRGIKELHIISVKNEVKELLWIIDWRKKNDTTIKLYNHTSKKKYSYQVIANDLQRNIDTELSSSENYLYEFNSSIMKSGYYDFLSQKYYLKKLETNSHIYTSNTLIHSFPGKVYSTIQEKNINFKQLKNQFKGKQLNIIAKNIQLSTNEIQKKIKCQIGSDDNYLIFTKTTSGNKVIEAKRLI